MDAIILMYLAGKCYDVQIFANFARENTMFFINGVKTLGVATVGNSPEWPNGSICEVITITCKIFPVTVMLLPHCGYPDKYKSTFGTLPAIFYTKFRN